MPQKVEKRTEAEQQKKQIQASHNAGMMTVITTGPGWAFARLRRGRIRRGLFCSSEEHSIAPDGMEYIIANSSPDRPGLAAPSFRCKAGDLYGGVDLRIELAATSGGVRGPTTANKVECGCRSAAGRPKSPLPHWPIS